MAEQDDGDGARCRPDAGECPLDVVEVVRPALDVGPPASRPAVAAEVDRGDVDADGREPGTSPLVAAAVLGDAVDAEARKMLDKGSAAAQWRTRRSGAPPSRARVSVVDVIVVLRVNGVEPPGPQSSGWDIAIGEWSASLPSRP